MRDWCALCFHTARFWIITWIQALSIDACSIVRAVVVEMAADHAFIVFTNMSDLAFNVFGTFRGYRQWFRFAVVVWISTVIWYAIAERTMQHWSTLGVVSTRGLYGARIHAFAVETCFIVRAVSVTSAAGYAFAFVTNLPWTAPGVTETIFRQRHTQIVLTNFAWSTVFVDSTIERRTSTFFALVLCVTLIVWRADAFTARVHITLNRYRLTSDLFFVCFTGKTV